MHDLTGQGARLVLDHECTFKERYVSAFFAGNLADEKVRGALVVVVFGHHPHGEHYEQTWIDSLSLIVLLSADFWPSKGA
jgi:hypothetical protein